MAIYIPESKKLPEEKYIIIRDKIPFNFSDPKASWLELNLSNFTPVPDRKRNEHLSDEQFQNLMEEFFAIVGEGEKGNILSGYIDYSYADIPLPKAYDLIFDSRYPNKFWEQKTIVGDAYK